MKRNKKNLKLYKETCAAVWKRCDGYCEVMVDKYWNACSDRPKFRCETLIHEDSAIYTNFLHTETRNGKPDEWVLDPKNIIFGCAKHHIEEEKTGIRVAKYEN